MAETLRVDPLALHKAGGDVLDAMDESTRAHAQHHEALESAMPGLPTESAGALQGLIAAWTEQREDLHRAIGNHGINMQDAAVKYHQADQSQGEHINAKAMDLGL
ncbi:MAG: hypothetical protein P4L86_13070 [Mycobacterium sp.]|nr:hypothetical protein [Mycobacterium sp.]